MKHKRVLHTAILIAGFSLSLSFCQIPTDVDVTPVFNTNTSIDLERPVWMGEVPGQPGVFLVLGQHDGVITRLAEGNNGYEAWEFYQLDVRATSNEEGLLGFAFHPEFTENRKYYIYYSTPSGTRASVIQERTASTDFSEDSGDDGRTIMTVNQPEWNHNGGHIGFGPDGYLYIGLGDGGGGGDQHGSIGNGQDRSTLLGSILRIDVDNTEGDNNYAIPDDNPFIGDNNVRPEIWAYGLRNPWRMSFDPLTDDLWVGDVGQVAREEIDIVTSGDNMGWRITEGNACYGSNSCDRNGLVDPILDYPRNEGTSVTGGYVFRANAESPFYGIYIFGDYSSRRIWAVTESNGNYSKTQIAQSPQGISSFATDAEGRIYVVGHGGTIYLLDHEDLEPGVTSVKARGKIKNPFFTRSQADTLVFNAGKHKGVTSLKLYTFDGMLVKALNQKELSGKAGVRLRSGVYIARLEKAGKALSQTVYLD